MIITLHLRRPVSQISINVRLRIVQDLSLALPDVLLLFVVDLQAALDGYEGQSAEYSLVKIRFHRVKKALSKYGGYRWQQERPTQHSRR